MNYIKHYNNLITRSKDRNLSCYLEAHHIVPKCIGGTDDSTNIVMLTPEEHYVAHQLLVKIYNHPGLIQAALMMSVSNYKHANGLGRKNKLYGWLKRKYLEVCKQRIGEKNGSFGKPWYYNPITLESTKFEPNKVPRGWIKGRVPPKLNYCKVCGEKTQTSLQLYCIACKPKKEQTVFRNIKEKSEYTDEEKLRALIKTNGNIRQALFLLGLNDSGPHYKKMKKIKASLYPLATNQLKG
jgi:hypothetical protein